MREEPDHLPDLDLLLLLDGEQPRKPASKARAHLTACWECRARMAEIENTITDFARVNRTIYGPTLPPIEGASAQLRARLAEVAAESRRSSWAGLFRFALATRLVAYISLTIITTVVISKVFDGQPTMKTLLSAITVSQPAVVPNRSLTPGAATQASVADVCEMAHEEVVKDVPAALRQRVFEEYEISNAATGNYEVDYLITPGLGGAQDIRNLWPEPSASLAWNSRVKDALEERLHQLVCSGKVDLPTAQHEIATDWIAAYKKYFSTDKPLGTGRLRLFGVVSASSKTPEL